MRKLLALAVPLLAFSSSALAQWSVVVLHPPGAIESWVHGAEGGRQFGSLWQPSGMPGVIDAAIAWSGTAESAVNLAPAGWARSIAFDSGGLGGPVFGYVGPDHGPSQAARWDANAEMWINLTPQGATSAAIYSADAGVQGGFAQFGAEHASLWRGTAESWVDLHPTGAVSSVVTAVSGDRQAGEVWYAGNTMHACAWSGTAQSFIDLNPAGASMSDVTCADGSRQGGYAYIGGLLRVGYWNGTAESWTDLTPVTAVSATVTGVFGEFQVGTVAFLESRSTPCIWNGTADSWEDLSGFVPEGYNSAFATCISGDAEKLYIGGCANNAATGRIEAIVWIRPRPASPCGPADIAGDGAAVGADGKLDNNDFIIFISSFFLQLPSADRGSDGGMQGADGRFDNNDFVAFITQFFTGC